MRDLSCGTARQREQFVLIWKVIWPSIWIDVYAVRGVIKHLSWNCYRNLIPALLTQAAGYSSVIISLVLLTTTEHAHFQCHGGRVFDVDGPVLRTLPASPRIAAARLTLALCALRVLAVLIEPSSITALTNVCSKSAFFKTGASGLFLEQV